MEKFTAGYCRDLSQNNDIEQTITTTYFGVDLSNTTDIMVITCPCCCKENYFYSGKEIYNYYICSHCLKVLVLA